jgi:NTP pyrophosphatase (non-canonical NTP hydrolase)
MNIYSEIEFELDYAKKKHPNYPTDIFKQLAIMQEEAGEVTMAVNDFSSGDCTIEHVREELIQTAAMCVRMIENLK